MKIDLSKPNIENNELIAIKKSIQKKYYPLLSKRN